MHRSILCAEHYVLRIHDGRHPPRMAHAGGHASYLGLLGTTAKMRRASTFYPKVAPMPSNFAHVSQPPGSAGRPRPSARPSSIRLPDDRRNDITGTPVPTNGAGL